MYNHNGMAHIVVCMYFTFHRIKGTWFRIPLPKALMTQPYEAYPKQKKRAVFHYNIHPILILCTPSAHLMLT